jgi:hypothetical protein
MLGDGEPEPEPPLAEDEFDVVVRRSELVGGAATWWVDARDVSTDLMDYAHPGPLRAVQRYAVSEYVEGDTSRAYWQRVTPDAYRLRVRAVSS